MQKQKKIKYFRMTNYANYWTQQSKEYFNKPTKSVSEQFYFL